MPVSRSAKKRVRVAERKQLRNKPVQSMSKSLITRAEKLVSSGDSEAAGQAVKAAVRSLDKAAGKKVIHPNNAARRKSRLVKKLNQASQSEPAK